jgi:hypothetical protein
LLLAKKKLEKEKKMNWEEEDVGHGFHLKILYRWEEG